MFSSSVPRRGPIEITAQLIHSIHDLSGLTYGVAIPLTAIAFRTIVTLPLSIYSQKKLNRRIELHPLFHQWGDIIGTQAISRAKANNVDLRGNQEAYEKMMTTVRKMVMPFIFEAKQVVAVEKNANYISAAWLYQVANIISCARSNTPISSCFSCAQINERMGRVDRRGFDGPNRTFAPV